VSLGHEDRRAEKGAYREGRGRNSGGRRKKYSKTTMGKNPIFTRMTRSK